MTTLRHAPRRLVAPAAAVLAAALLVSTGSAASASVATAGVTAGTATTVTTAAATVTTVVTTASIDLTSLSINSPRSIWVVVNKKRPLNPKSWKPTDLTSVTVGGTSGKLRKAAASALKRMAAASNSATGRTLTITSSYRSYTTQVSVYKRWKALYGKKKADLLSARPGYSEHQTGLAVDVAQKGTSCGLSACFGNTKTGKWLAKNAWKYGYIVRYPKGKTSVTGYDYEPWHLRYVGKALATYMHNKNIKTLETVFGLGSAKTY